MEIDIHGYHPDNILETGIFTKLVQQAWEMGEPDIYFIHGHGKKRGISVGFVNTNTGFFGLRVRSELRHSDKLRQWIKRTTLDCSDPGCTGIKLKRNESPTRTKLDELLKPPTERPFKVAL
jgi:hypothetical protein